MNRSEGVLNASVEGNMNGLNVILFFVGEDLASDVFGPRLYPDGLVNTLLPFSSSEHSRT